MYSQYEIFKKQNLPIVRWQMPNNRTHGIIKAFVDLKSGRKPSSVKVYFAKTLDNRRLISNISFTNSL